MTNRFTSALFHGFLLSTAYGQESGKRMPITDSATLLKFAREVIRLSGVAQPPTGEE